MSELRRFAVASALAIGFAATVMPTASRADIVGDTASFAFTTCGSGLSTCSLSGSSVTLTVTSVGATETIAFNVVLGSGISGFVNTGLDASFAFNSTVSPLSFTGITANWEVNNGSPGGFGVNSSASTGSIHMDGYGFFGFGLSANTTGGSSSIPSPLTFSITGTGLTLASLGSSFVADVLMANCTSACTGPIGTGLVPVPLPGAAMLFGTALIGMGLLGRRRRKAALTPV